MPNASEQASIPQPSVAASQAVEPRPQEIQELSPELIQDFSEINASPIKEVVSPVDVSSELVQENKSTEISMENIEPILVENVTENNAKITGGFSEMLFGKVEMTPEEQAQKEIVESEIAKRTRKDDLSDIKDKSIEAANMYDIGNWSYESRESEESLKDGLRRKLGAGQEIIEYIDKNGKPENPKETMLNSKVHFETAQAVQEYQGQNKLEGRSFKEAVLNQASDKRIKEELREMQEKTGGLDREIAARTVAAVGQEVITVEEFREIKEGLNDDVGKSDISSLQKSRIGFKNGDIVLISEDGDNLMTINKVKATVVLADVMVAETGDKNLSVTDQKLKVIEGKLRQTGFALSSFNDEFVVNGEPTNNGSYIDVEIKENDDGSIVFKAKDNPKCLAAETVGREDLNKSFNHVNENKLAKNPIIPEVKQIVHIPESHLKTDKLPVKPPEIKPVEPIMKPKDENLEIQKAGQREKIGVSIIKPIPNIEIGASLRQAFAKTELLGIFLNASRQQPDFLQRVFPALAGKNLDFINGNLNLFSLAPDGFSQKLNPQQVSQKPVPSDGGFPSFFAPVLESSFPNQGSGKVDVMAPKKTSGEKNASQQIGDRLQSAFDKANIEVSTRATDQAVSKNTEQVKSAQNIDKKSAGSENASSNVSLSKDNKTTTEVSFAHSDTTNSAETVNAEVAKTQINSTDKSSTGQKTETAFVQTVPEGDSNAAEPVKHSEIKVAAKPQEMRSTDSIKKDTHSETKTQEVASHSQEISELQQTPVTQSEVMRILNEAANFETVVASGVASPENTENQTKEKENLDIVEEAASLGTNEKNIRLDPSMMSSFTTQSFAQSPFEPEPKSGRVAQLDTPQIKATLSLAKSLFANDHFPASEPIKAKDFVNSVFSGILA